MSDTDTNAIDSKKTQNEDGSTSEIAPNYLGFAGGLISYSLYILFVFGIVGSIGLYTCKIAQTNILPDNIEYMPFGNKIKKVDDNLVNINIIKEYGFFGLGWIFGETPKVFSTKLKFDQNSIMKDYDNGFIGMINSLKNSPENSSFLGLYIRDVFLSMISINNLYVNKIYGLFNEYLPETVIILFYPLFLVMSSIFMLIANMFLSFFYQIKYWGDFFMDRSVKDGKVRWNEPFTYLRPWRSFCLFLYFIFLLFPMNFIIASIVNTYAFLSPLFISAELDATNQSYGFIQCLQDVLLYKSQLFLILLTYGLIAESIQYLGINGVIGCSVGIIIAFFFLHLYNQYIPKDSTVSTPGLVAMKQAKMKGGNFIGGNKKHK